MIYWLVAIVLAVVAAAFLFLGFQKRNEPGEEDAAQKFIIIGMVAVFLFILVQFGALSWIGLA